MAKNQTVEQTPLIANAPLEHQAFPGEAEIKETAIEIRPPQAVTPMRLVELAVTQGADIEKLGKLLDLQERWEKNEARKAFVTAMNDFKANPPEILKNRHVEFGNTKYDHATLDHVCLKVNEALGRHGISHRWRVEQNGGVIRVACILTHCLGHSEETTLEGSPDTSGSKNSIQAIGSTVTYLQRYTLLAATGLAAAGSDTDGQSPQTPKFEKLQEFLDSMATAPNMEVLKKTYEVAFDAAKKIGDTDAQKRLIKAKNDRKEILLKEEAA